MSSNDTATYGWIIDAEYEQNEHDRTVRAVKQDDVMGEGAMGPRDITDAITAALQRGHGFKFRMYDDDQYLMAAGRLEVDRTRAGGVNDLEDYEVFGPLDDLGRGNWGCTEIRYWINGKWVSI